MAEPLLEFLVTTELRPVVGLAPEERARLYREERERGFELARSGAIRQIWRIPGAPYRTVSIRVAPTVAALQADLESLPLFDWLKIEVTPLAAHPLSEPPPA
ncbi:muconolactone Delta-isomerase family protein [Phytohabitans kaempferiae]|uniref:Muconolactone Delta-isomerase family protein n=1 Tax=Phytohabitans kaempferiae TaxID=1620943 RepID=A0ABV6LZD8_9ACTN